MTLHRIFAPALCLGIALALAAGCATTNEGTDESKLPKPTITYEDIDSGPAPATGATAQAGQPAQPGTAGQPTQPAQPAQPAAPADPFSGCMAKMPQQGMASLDCGTTDAVIVNVVGKLTPEQVDQNFQAYAKNFPADAKQEKYTRQIGTKTAQAIRLTGNNYAASMLILPHGSKHTRVIACRVQQSTDYSRCQAITEQLGSEGIPPAVTGADQLPGYLVARPKPGSAQSAGNNAGATDGGSPAPMMDGGAAH